MAGMNLLTRSKYRKLLLETDGTEPWFQQLLGYYNALFLKIAVIVVSIGIIVIVCPSAAVSIGLIGFILGIIINHVSLGGYRISIGACAIEQILYFIHICF